MNPEFTERAADAVQSSDWSLYSSADLLRDGQLLPGSEGISLEESGAEVQVDGTGRVRRTFSAAIADPLQYLPLSTTGALSPFLTEIRLWSGVRYPDGTVDRWAVFTGRIEDPQVVDNGNVTLTITGSDRAQDISDRRLPTAYQIADGTLTTDAIIGLVHSVRPDIEFQVITPLGSPPTVPGIIIDELEDPMEHAADFAAAAGLEFFFDGMGVGIIRPIPDPDVQQPVWIFTEGELQVFNETTQKLSSKDSYSHAIVKGMSLDGAPPVRSDRYDTDMSSPTYFDPAIGMSAFGDKPVALVSDLITNQGQADVACEALLLRKKRAVENLSMTSSPITAFDEYDVVYYNQERLGINSGYSLEKFNIPLSVDGTQSLACRSRRF